LAQGWALLSQAVNGGGDAYHIATNKNNTSPARGGPWTPRFKAMFDQAGMSMNDGDNVVDVIDHAGPHPEAYHQEVYNRLQNATAGLSGAEYASALRGALQSIGRELATPGSPLNLLVTR
jgi:filamentous hemagglutinin